MRERTQAFIAGASLLIIVLAGALAYNSLTLRFCWLTGLRVPFGAKDLRTADDHGGFHGDGEYYAVFKTEDRTVQSWLAKPAPWSRQKWEKGPVPPHAGLHAGFGHHGTGMSVVRSANGSTREEYFGGSPEIMAVLQSSNVWFSCRARGPKDMPWYNGDLIILDPNSSMVWLSSWDN